MECRVHPFNDCSFAENERKDHRGLSESTDRIDAAQDLPGFDDHRSIFLVAGERSLDVFTSACSNKREGCLCRCASCHVCSFVSASGSLWRVGPLAVTQNGNTRGGAGTPCRALLTQAVDRVRLDAMQHNPSDTVRLKMDRFDDFHTFGASAPEWEQRYEQISRGAMRSTMAEIALGGARLYWKTMSQRVVQQGRIPMGKICFAVLARPSSAVRIEGHEFTDTSLLVLHGGDEFVMQRPAQMQLLAITMNEAAFHALAEQQPDARRLRSLLRRRILEGSPAALQELRSRMLAMFIWGAGATEFALPSGSDVAMEALIHTGLLDVLSGSAREPVRYRGLSAHVLVSECHRITLASINHPPSVAELSTRLRASRRALQGSFQKVAETTPVDYLRSLRLNVVRRNLHCTSPAETSIGQIASNAGFSQMSHFAAEYKRLFDELPSQTLRAVLNSRHHQARNRAQF